MDLKNNLDQNQVANQCYQFIESKAEIKSVLQSGVVPSNNIYVENKDGKFFITGGGLNFSLEGLGYSKKMRFDFSTVVDEKITVDSFNAFF